MALNRLPNRLSSIATNRLPTLQAKAGTDTDCGQEVEA